MTTRTFYRDYMLSCQPRRMDNGRYEAHVAISAMGGDKTRAQRFPDLEGFETEQAAVDCALRSGMEWIDANDKLR